MPKPPAQVYELRVSLKDVEPEIWRSLEVRGDTTFETLHVILQIAMGWEDSHLYIFRSGRQQIGAQLEDDFGPPILDDRRVTLADVVPTTREKRKKLEYEYDFGDSWLHEIKVLSISAPAERVRYPRCTGGARAGPPEDCGGAFGYMRILEELAAPAGKGDDELLEWVGEGFDPEAFDIKAVNRLFGRMR